MDIPAYVLLSQEQALRRRLDIVANNLANMNTAGFGREAPVFREYVEDTPSSVKPVQQTSFVLDYGTIHDTTQGAFQSTGNPLDLMIDGPGYFAVEAPGGGTAYTRAGYIRVLPSGELATAGGQRILGEGGQPVTVPLEQAGRIDIRADGTVSGPDGPLGRIAVTVFDNESGVTPRGDGMFAATGGRELPAEQTRLRGGGVESSNVNPIEETTNMVEILRAYQESQRMAEAMNDLRRRAIERLGRVN